jgi:hypothetical protein
MFLLSHFNLTFYLKKFSQQCAGTTIIFRSNWGSTQRPPAVSDRMDLSVLFSFVSRWGFRLSPAVRANGAASAFCSTGRHCSGSSRRRNGRCKMQRPSGLAHSWGCRRPSQLNYLRASHASPFPCRAPASHLHHPPSPVHAAGAEPRGRRPHRCRSDARQSGSG